MRGKKTFCSLLLVMCALFLFCACGSDSSGSGGAIGRGKSAAEQTEDAESDTDSDLYMIELLDSAEENITLRQLSGDRMYRYPFSLATRFLDAYGNPSSQTNFMPGRIVTIGDRLESGALSEIRMSDASWEQDNVTNFSIDTDRNVFTIGNTNYQLTDQTIVYSGDTEALLSDIRDSDVLRVVGIDKKICSLSVTTGHGYLYVYNTDLFNGSLMSVGTGIFTLLNGETTLEVPEGTYDVTVANNGYGGTRQVTISRGQTTSLDLSELQGEGPKTSLITFHVSVSGAAIYFDGQQVAADQQITASYGAHSLQVIAEGYNTWNKTLYVNSPTADITLELSEEDSSSESASSDSSSDSTGSSSGSSGSSTGSSSGSSGSSSGSSSSGSSSGSSSDSRSSSADLDYLTTLSNMISKLTGSSDD